MTSARMRRSIFFLTLFTLVLLIPDTAIAYPGGTYGNHMWYKPGTSATGGTLYRYKSYTNSGGQQAGSGNGPNWNNPCISFQGRLSNGWYNSANGHHVNNKDNLIKGRVWGLTDKACSTGILRTELFIHTEETKNNGQDCPTSGDDPYCWEGASDFTSNGCVKVSHPEGVATLHNWWHGAPVSGGHGLYYPIVLWVGTGYPPLE